MTIENIKANFTYTTAPISIMVYKDDSRSVVSYITSFEYTIKMNTSHTIYDRLSAVSNFFTNLHGSMAISSYSEFTPMLVTGQLNIPTIEMPIPSFHAYELSAILFYKVSALLGETADIISFKAHTETPMKSTTELNIKELLVENPMIDEDSWVRAMNQIAEDEKFDPEELEFSKPWWRRPTGELRDFFNHIDYEDETQISNLMAFNIDLGIDMESIITSTVLVDEDIKLAKTILEEYDQCGGIPDNVLREFKDLANEIGFELDDFLASISNGAMFKDYDEDGTIRNIVIETLSSRTETKAKDRKGKASNKKSKNNDGNKPKPTTIVKL